MANRTHSRLPHFIIGGAPRSGTTFLCHALEKNTTVFLAKPYVPEPKVFMGVRRSAEEYAARYDALFSGARPGSILGEKTSYYLESELACMLIKETVPKARLIFIVREPVARAYSNYLWSTRNGIEALPFAEAIDVEGIRADPMPAEKSYARPFDYLVRGDYAKFARRYFDTFGREQVRFFLYEDIEADPERLLSSMQQFIGVRPLPFSSMNPGVINSARDDGPPLNEALAQRLRKLMAPKVDEFAALSGLDLSLWHYD